MKTSDVFGITPQVREYSYIDRGNLDETMNTILGRTTHIAVRGPSKCGKSWLRQRVLKDPIVVQCRLRKPYTDIYIDALSQLGITVRIKDIKQGKFHANISASGEAGAALLAKAGFSASLGRESATTTEERAIGHDIQDLHYIAEIIKASERKLVVEDFHYMSTEDRRNFAFDLKALWDYNVFVVIIGVWTDTNLLLYLNPDLTGRVTEIKIDWNNDDLTLILTKGGSSLHIDFDPKVKCKLVDMSYSNAGLLQQLALLTLDDAKIFDASFIHRKKVDSGEHVDAAGMMYAEQLNTVYQQFAKRVAAGMRTRKNSTGIYAHAMAVMMEASDEELIKGLHARTIFERATIRQSRIQYSNLKAILEKLQELQTDEHGRGLILGYSPAIEEVTIVDRQLLLYRRFATVKWPWEELIDEADASGGQIDPD
ncbi:MAG: hypothetical protein ABFD69_14810 [Candidatus Sumerlaeia bacterium]